MTTPIPWKDRTRLSDGMVTAIDAMKADSGEIRRYPGGYWKVSGVSKRYWTRNVVCGLVSRGLCEYVEKDPHGMPIRAKLVETKSQ